MPVPYIHISHLGTRLLFKRNGNVGGNGFIFLFLLHFQQKKTYFVQCHAHLTGLIRISQSTYRKQSLKHKRNKQRGIKRQPSSKGKPKTKERSKNKKQSVEEQKLPNPFVQKYEDAHKTFRNKEKERSNHCLSNPNVYRHSIFRICVN